MAAHISGPGSLNKCRNALTLHLQKSVGAKALTVIPRHFSLRTVKYNIVSFLTNVIFRQSLVQKCHSIHELHLPVQVKKKQNQKIIIELKQFEL